MNGPAIAAIYGYHVTQGTGSFETEPPDVEDMRRRRADILVRGLPYLVAEGEGGAILGYAYASAYRPRPAYRFAVYHLLPLADPCEIFPMRIEEVRT